MAITDIPQFPSRSRLWVMGTLAGFWARCLDGSNRPRPGERLIVLPLGLAVGSAAWFAFPGGPPSAPGGLLMTAGLAVIAAALRSPTRRLALIAILAGAALLGAGRSAWRVDAVSAPIVAESNWARELTGWIEAVETSAGRERLRIRVAELEGADSPPVRLRVRADRNGFAPGEMIRLRAVLRPPSRPVAPGAYDFGYHAWFARLGGSGYAIGPAQAAPDRDGARFARSLAGLRWRLAERVRARIAGPEGGIAAALLTGDRSGIDPASADALRASGLGHILAISGLHMALLAGGVFFAARLAFAAIGPFARRHDPRLPAAWLALAAGAGYLLLSGLALPTQRAFIMTAVAFGAVIAGRRALSMASLALAMTIILLLQPESIRSAGFQMSFAATGALIAAYEAWRERSGAADSGPASALASALGRVLGGLSFTSLVAGFATSAFAAFHFHRLAMWGFPANLFAMPVFSLIVMPAGALALALAPLGLDGPALWVMGKGLSVVLYIADTASGAPGALQRLDAAPGWTLAAYAAGFALVCAGRGMIRLAGLAAALIAFLGVQLHDAPDFRIGERGLVFARFDGEAEAGWRVSHGRRERFTGRVFQERSGGEGAPPATRALQCDAQACLAHIDELAVVWRDRAEGWREDCRRAGLILIGETLPYWRRGGCDALVLDVDDLARSGGRSVWIEAGAIVRMRRVEDSRRGWPWSRLD